MSIEIAILKPFNLTTSKTFQPLSKRIAASLIKQQNGVTGYEILLKETDDKLVGFELDIFWAVNAGLNLVDMFSKNLGQY
jgi:hypothetical protein